MGKKIAAVVLAGGRSSRMGQDKALLDYNGKPLLDHMVELLERVGISDIYVSGNWKGYRCLPDSAPYKGPAHAIYDVLQQLRTTHDAVLFVPIDMPLLTVDMLSLLIHQAKGAHFTNFPLPAFIASPYPKERKNSVKALLASTKNSPINLPPEFEKGMTNTNTPEEWAEALHA